MVDKNELSMLGWDAQLIAEVEKSLIALRSRPELSNPFGENPLSSAGIYSSSVQVNGTSNPFSQQIHVQ